MRCVASGWSRKYHLGCDSRAMAPAVVATGAYASIFAGTVAENIAYGVKGATREQVAEAARRPAIHDEIAAMRGGYDAVPTERGMTCPTASGSGSPSP